MSAGKEKVVLNILLIGDTGYVKGSIVLLFIYSFFQCCVCLVDDNDRVGKTVLMNMFASQRFPHIYRKTIGFDFLDKDIVLEGNPVTLRIWDTGGAESLDIIPKLFHRKAVDVVVLVYDWTWPKTFEHLDHWREEFLKHAAPPNPDQFPFVLVGTKTDKKEDLFVSRESIEQWCSSRGGIPHFEVSARGACSGYEEFKEDYARIEEAFMCAAKRASSLNDNQEDATENPEDASEPQSTGCIIA